MKRQPIESFDVATNEQGDMAIYYEDAWKVVAGNLGITGGEAQNLIANAGLHQGLRFWEIEERLYVDLVRLREICLAFGGGK